MYCHCLATYEKSGFGFVAALQPPLQAFASVSSPNEAGYYGAFILNFFLLHIFLIQKALNNWCFLIG
jgi:hypothetical protein